MGAHLGVGLPISNSKSFSSPPGTGQAPSRGNGCPACRQHGEGSDLFLLLLSLNCLQLTEPLYPGGAGGQSCWSSPSPNSNPDHRPPPGEQGLNGRPAWGGSPTLSIFPGSSPSTVSPSSFQTLTDWVELQVWGE